VQSGGRKFLRTTKSRSPPPAGPTDYTRYTLENVTSETPSFLTHTASEFHRFSTSSTHSDPTSFDMADLQIEARSTLLPLPAANTTTMYTDTGPLPSSATPAPATRLHGKGYHGPPDRSSLDALHTCAHHTLLRSPAATLPRIRPPSPTLELATALPTVDSQFCADNIRRGTRAHRATKPSP
jgi:hypothetical protein